MLFRQFSNLTTYVREVGKLSDQQFNASLVSNPGEKIMIIIEGREQICPVVLVFFKNILPWIGEQWYIKMYFQQFSRNSDIGVIPGKLSEFHLHAWLFSNPRGKVLINVIILCSPDMRVQHI